MVKIAQNTKVEIEPNLFLNTRERLFLTNLIEALEYVNLGRKNSFLSKLKDKIARAVP
jgi:hypothetical protein